MNAELEKELVEMVPKKRSKIEKCAEKANVTVNRKIYDYEDEDETELEHSVKLMQKVLIGRANQKIV